MIPGAESTPLSAGKNVEVWGGVECTVNRIGDRYVDQIELCGHASRLEDLDLLAGVGSRAPPHPGLGGVGIGGASLSGAVGARRAQPSGGCRWSHTDRSLNKLREDGIIPIVGLV